MPKTLTQQLSNPSPQSPKKESVRPKSSETQEEFFVLPGLWEPVMFTTRKAPEPPPPSPVKAKETDALIDTRSGPRRRLKLD